MSETAGILERYRRGAEVVAVAATGAAGAQLDFQPSPGAWSVRQILGHLADAELLAAVRFRRIIAEDNPPLLAYDQNAWAERLHYEKRRVSEVLDTFRRLRAANHSLLAEQAEEAFARTGTHPDSGPTTLLDLVRMYIDHTEKHASRMMTVRSAYKARATEGA
jgi:hypothetical protein